MKQVDKITVKKLKEMATHMFGDLVKADVDIEKRLVVVDMPMHYEGEAFLMQNGSKQNNIWGINLHPDDFGTDDFIEFDSMINIRPSQGNPSKDVLDESARQKIVEIIQETVHD